MKKLLAVLVSTPTSSFLSACATAGRHFEDAKYHSTKQLGGAVHLKLQSMPNVTTELNNIPAWQTATCIHDHQPKSRISRLKSVVVSAKKHHKM